MEEQRKLPPDQDDRKEPETDGAREKLNIPRYLLPVYLFCCFFTGFAEYFKRSAAETFGFYKEFFGGLPIFFSYLRVKRRRKRAVAASKKRKKKLMRREKKNRVRSEKKEQRSEEAFEKKLDRRQKREERKKKRLERRSRFLRILPHLLILSLIVLELAFCCRFVVLYVIDGVRSSEDSVTMNVYFEKSDQKKTTVPAKYAHGSAEGSLRFDMTFLANALGIRTFGTEESVLYTTADGQKLRVYKDSNKVMINGREIDLNDAVRFDGSKVYVPLELLIKYTTGLEISYDRKTELLTLVCIKNAAKIAQENNESILSFLPCGDSPAGSPLLL